MHTHTHTQSDCTNDVEFSAVVKGSHSFPDGKDDAILPPLLVDQVQGATGVVATRHAQLHVGTVEHLRHPVTMDTGEVCCHD